MIIYVSSEKTRDNDFPTRDMNPNYNVCEILTLILLQLASPKQRGNDLLWWTF